MGKEITIKSSLKLDADSLVGYRISVPQRGVYDISVDDLNLIVEDFECILTTPTNLPTITLVAQGNQFVPQNAKDAEEMNYAKFATIMRYTDLGNTDTELKKLYNHYNKLMFKNKLPKLVAVEWSTRMTSSAGYCRSIPKNRMIRTSDTNDYKHLIKLSVPYHERFTDEVVDTLVHEMIHVLYPTDGHGYAFKSQMDLINSQFGMKLAVRATGSATVNYVYACENCGQEYERIRKMKNLNNVRCGKSSCRGSIYLKEDHTDDMFDDTDWSQYNY